MASLGHVAVGMVAARLQGSRVPHASSMAAWSALSLLPDLDVVGFMFGVEYGDPWGHRGATHSLTLSVALGLAIGLAARRFNRPALRTALLACAVLVSHALLDTMTDGGLGCALFWPFDLTRYFAPWQPIPVAPIGLDYFSPYGLMVFLAELLLFAPLLVFALRSRPPASRAIAILLALWMTSLSVLWFSETTRDRIAGFLLREDTAYAAGFSESAFGTITPGQSESDVRQALGPPLGEFWLYIPPDPRPLSERPAPSVAICLEVAFEAGVVVATYDIDVCKARGVQAGASAGDVSRRLGLPLESCWQYTKSPRNGPYRERLVCFANGRVKSIVRRWA